MREKKTKEVSLRGNVHLCVVKELGGHDGKGFWGKEGGCGKGTNVERVLVP